MVASDITGQLAQYMVESREQSLPPDVGQAAKHRILDSIGAIVSGARLRPGELAIRYVRSQGGTLESSVLATDLKTSAVNAALVNGMFGHADETDDFEPVTKAHPGCSVVPAALAMAEKEGSSGEEMLRAVVLGYDLCCRFLLALGPDLVRGGHRSAEGTSSTMEALRRRLPWPSWTKPACVTSSPTPPSRSRVSGVGCGTWSMWRRLSTFPAWEPATESLPPPWCRPVSPGFGTCWKASTMCWRPFLLHPARRNVARSGKPVSSLTETAIKPYPVGYPIQPALDAFFALHRQHDLTVEKVASVTIRLPQDGAGIVNNRSMPDVNCQHMIGLALVDGAVTFESTHSRERMSDPAVMAVKETCNSGGLTRT